MDRLKPYERSSCLLHLSNRAIGITGFEIDPAHGIYQDGALESALAGIEGRSLDAVVGRQPPDKKFLDAFPLKQLLKWDAIQGGPFKTRIAIGVRIHPLGNDFYPGREVEVRMKGGPVGVLHTMNRPDSPVGRKVFGPFRVPVTCDVDGKLKLDGQVEVAIQDRHNLIALRHGEGAARAEVVLHIHDDEGLLAHRRDIIGARAFSWQDNNEVRSERKEQEWRPS